VTTTTEKNMERSRTEPEHKVVVNALGQYALWPAWRPTPAGWTDAGCAGTKEECLEFVRRVWPEGPRPGRAQ
jgi:MbtH protein